MDPLAQPSSEEAPPRAARREWIGLAVIAPRGRRPILREEEGLMGTARSEDGTTIAFDRLGEGPPVVLVCGRSVSGG